MQRTALIFIGAPVALLVVAILVLVIALAVSGDLEPVKAQARADGLQTDWSDPRWNADRDHAVALAEIEAVAAGVVLHAGSHGFSRSYHDETGTHTSTLGQRGSVIPPALRDYYGGEAPAWMTAFSAWRQRYSARPLRLAHPADRLVWESGKSLRSMIDWLSYRILLSEEASPEEVLALLDAIDLLPFDFGWQAMRRWQLFVRVTTLLNVRQDTWRDRMDTLIAALRARREHLENEYRHALQGQFIGVCVLIAGDPHDAARDYGIAVPAWFEIAACARMVHQLGRVDVLNRQRAVTVDLLASPDLMSSLLLAPTGCLCGSGQSHGWNSAELLDAVFNYERNVWVIGSTFHKTRLTLDLTIADLTGKPWPRDPMDPAGGPLTPWLENGVAVGAISMGPDRLPGTHDDWRLRLRDLPLPTPTTAAPSLPTAAPVPHPAE